MTEKALLEPSFVEAMAAIEGTNDLPARTRSHWICSLRQIAKAMDKPLEIIPARWTAVHFAIAGLHHARVGSTPKTLANHKSNARAALLWFAQETKLPRRGTPLTAEWNTLRSKLAHQHSRAALSSLMRYCSAQGVAPNAVDETIIDGFMLYRSETTALASDDAARRAIARAWNGCVGAIAGWPAQRLIESSVKAKEGPAWEEFSEGLRSEIDAHLQGLTQFRRSFKGKRIRPCKASTIRTRRAELVAVAKRAVREGIPIASLTSLKALLDPDVVERVIDAYWKADGTVPQTFTIDLGWKLLSLARQIGCLEAHAIERLDDIRASLEEHRRNGLTDKNQAVIRQVLAGNIWREVYNLPRLLMAQARLLRDHAPIKAAVTAQIAVAIAILLVAPIRLGNLIRIRLGENLIKPGGLDCPYMLVFPDYDVKNRVQLEFPLDTELTALIDEYIHEFRSSLLRGSNELWLFPGEAGGFKDAKSFSGQITERIEKATGLRITVHQFRHAAVAFLLKHRPGEYELARRLLGHRNIQTTIAFYSGLETAQANMLFGDLLNNKMRFGPDAA
jgi:integrase